MSEAVVAKPDDPAKEFERWVIEKIRTDIGSLIPDAVLAELAQKAIQETFFTPTWVPNPDRGYGRPDRVQTGPSWFQTAIHETIVPLLKTEAARAVETHKELIAAAVAEELTRDKLLAAVSVSVAQEAGAVMSEGMRQVIQDLRAGIIR